MSSGGDFRPNWGSAPGDTIADILSEKHISLAEFSELIGQNLGDTTDLLQGRATITLGVARKLEVVLGGSVGFWMSRDFQYRQDMTRLHNIDEAWLTQLPLSDMVAFGWLKPRPRPSDEMEACLRFFDVRSVSAWHSKYARLTEMTAFRTSQSFESRPAAVAAWLRQGEIRGESIQCAAWDSRCFERSLSHVRSLTRQKDPKQFLPDLVKLCASSGVAVAVVRSPNGCRASGATRFISGTKALLLFSFRYLSDDQFWFTFFHEAGHLILHGENGFFLEGVEQLDAVKEHEANEFAERKLIPSEFRGETLALPLNSREVLRFARKLGIAPGIVVGQLQHYGKFGRNQLNGLKRRYSWEG